MGLSEDLTIDGQAARVTRVDENQYRGWKAYGGDKLGTRYSAATQIKPDNVASLEPAWLHKSGTFVGREHVRSSASFEATPMTYLYEGRQYVVLAAGGHSSAGTKLGDNVTAFALSEN